MPEDHCIESAELAPPDSADPDEVYKRARVFDGYVDAVNATNGSGANCHMSSVAVCALLGGARSVVVTEIDPVRAALAAQLGVGVHLHREPPARQFPNPIGKVLGTYVIRMLGIQDVAEFHGGRLSRPGTLRRQGKSERDPERKREPADRSSHDCLP